MKIHILPYLSFLLLGSLFLAACSSASVETTNPTPVVQQENRSSTLVPLDAERCKALRADVSDVLGVEVARSEQGVPFQDSVSGRTGESCQLFASGTGEEFSSFVEVAGELGTLFRSKGWAEEMAYLADGPTGTVQGFRQDDMLALMRVGWSPSGDAACAADEPISACAETLEPSQMLYTITVDLVQQ